MRVQIEDWWGFWFEHNRIEVAEALRDKFKSDWLGSSQYQRVELEEKKAIEDAEDARNKEHARIEALALQHAAQQREDEDREREAERTRVAQQRMTERARAAQRQKEEIIREQQEADARRAQFDLTVKDLNTTELCAAFHETGYDSARSELRLRKALSAEEWALVGEHKIAVGMSETALLCSWGRARANRTVTATNTHKQYIYGSTLVYVENGRVTAFQDQQQ